MFYDFSGQAKKKPADPNASGFAAPGKMSVADATAKARGAMSPAPSMGYQGPMPDGSSWDTEARRQQVGIYDPGQVDKDYRARKESRAAGLMWNQEQARTAQQSQMGARLNQEAFNAQQAARANAAKRGLMSAGNSGVYQGMLANIDKARTSAYFNGLNEIDLNLSNRQQDFDLRRAGQEDSYALGLQGIANQLARQPHEVYGLMLQNEGQGVRNQGGMLQNQLTQLDLAMRQGLDSKLYEAKRSELERAIAEGRLAQWEAENDWWLGGLKFAGNAAVQVAKAKVGGA